MRLVLAALLALSCARPVPPPEVPAPPVPALNAEAVAGIESPILRQLLHDHWERLLEVSPELASFVGDHRYDDRVDDISPEALEAVRKTRQALIARARAIDPSTLSETDRISLQMLLFELEADEADEVCRFYEWAISPRGNAVGWSNDLHKAFPVMTRDAARSLLSRYKQVPARIDQEISNLRQGIESGRVANAESVRRTLELVEAEVNRPETELEILAPVRLVTPDGWGPEDWVRTQDALRTVVLDQIRPAWTRYRDFLRDELLPVARGPDAVGMGALPDGAACYAARVGRFTTLPLSADTVHQRGLEAMAGVHAEFRELGQRVYGTEDLAVLFEKLRTDPALRFKDEAEVLAYAEQALADAKVAMPGSFHRLPEADVVVEEMPAFEAPYSTIAYYRQALADGSRPGAYVVNTWDPTSRPRFEARALAFHEAIPGHHLQIAIAQELPETPAFRRHMGATAFVEGWALYAERLAEEQGLYKDDLDRLGMLSFDAWRAARLVVDTGIHDQGWTREQAIAYMRESTPLALNNIDNEVDRYISWPGQALAYKTGQQEIFALRARAEAALGERFDLAAFHDVVLGGGALTLPALADRVDAWIQQVEAAPD